MSQIFWLKCINLVFRSPFLWKVGSGHVEELFSLAEFSTLLVSFRGLFKRAVEYLSFSIIIL